MTIENEAYSNLPLIMNNAQRDPTAFGTLAPGAQGGARLPLIGGTGNYLGQLYLDGLPAQTVSQQGDNRLVSQSISVDAVDQMQVITSTPPAEFSGAGAENFTMKSGGLQYHGSVADFIRNTSLDAWQFSKGATKPVDHQNELAVTLGGHVPGTKRVFFFFAYDRYHSRTFNNPSAVTIPTARTRWRLHRVERRRQVLADSQEPARPTLRSSLTRQTTAAAAVRIPAVPSWA